MISITTAEKIVNCHRLICGTYWHDDFSHEFHFNDKETDNKSDGEKKNPYSDKSSARQFAKWLKETLDITVTNEIILNNKDMNSLLKKMAGSINADEIDLLTKLCALYEKITELLPYVVMVITQNNVEFALSDTLGDGISLNNFFDDNDIKDDVFQTLPYTLSKKLKGQFDIHTLLNYLKTI